MSEEYRSLENKSAIDRLRAKAKRHGMLLRKARGHQHLNQRGGLQLLRGYDEHPLEGLQFELDLKQAAYWIRHFAQRHRMAGLLLQD